MPVWLLLFDIFATLPLHLVLTMVRHVILSSTTCQLPLLREAYIEPVAVLEAGQPSWLSHGSGVQNCPAEPGYPRAS